MCIWGRNNSYQLGNGTSDSATPLLVNGGHTWATIDGGETITCGLTTAGAAYCWGRGNEGEFGNGSFVGQNNTPQAIGGGHTWASISAGYETVCGVTTSNAGYCWGRGIDDQLGNGGATNQNTPQAISGGYSWAKISAGHQLACGVTTAGAGYCWGIDNNGGLGDGVTGADSNTPVAISGGYTWASVSATDRYACGVTTTGVGYCWGLGSNGELGTGNSTTQNTPTLVLGSHAWASITTGYGVTCGYTTGSVGYCWGANGLGALGDGNFTTANTPQPISGGYAFTSISGGGGGACGLTPVGMIYCWGYDLYGTLGDGGSANQDVPVAVLTLSANISNATASATVDPTFTFTVANQPSTCNGESNFVSGAGTASTVALGHLAASANASGGQSLSVAGNAGSGFVVYVAGTQGSQDLRSNGHSWADVSGTYASPAALGAGEAFGYTYKDSTAASSVTNPGSATFIALTNAGTNAVMGSASSETGSGCVSYDARTSAATPAGTYNATVIYTAVPSY